MWALLGKYKFSIAKYLGIFMLCCFMLWKWNSALEQNKLLTTQNKLLTSERDALEQAIADTASGDQINQQIAVETLQSVVKTREKNRETIKDAQLESEKAERENGSAVDVFDAMLDGMHNIYRDAVGSEEGDT